MENFESEVRNWAVSPQFHEDFRRWALNSAVARHIMELDDASLEHLAHDGILLLDDHMIAAGNIGYDAVHILTKQRGLTQTEFTKWNMPRFTPRQFFFGLEEFAIVERHCLGRDRDGRLWAEMDRGERISKALAYIMMMDPIAAFLPFMKASQSLSSAPSRRKRVSSARHRRSAN